MERNRNNSDYRLKKSRHPVQDEVLTFRLAEAAVTLHIEDNTDEDLGPFALASDYFFPVSIEESPVFGLDFRRDVLNLHLVGQLAT